MSDEPRKKPVPTPVGDEVARYLKASGLDEKIEEASVIPQWAEKVGEKIASVTTPLHTGEGTLVVAVRSSAWLMELKLMEREIVRRINEGKRTGRIDRIRFVMGEGL
jgi:predicted nucleic acid-binding Zn ribbon protein